MWWLQHRWHKPIIIDLGPRKGFGEPFAKRRAGKMRRKARLFRIAEKMSF